MNKQEISELVKEFILLESNIDDESIISDDMDFFEEGIIDSIMAIALLDYCSEKFSCDITIDKLGDEGLNTINGLSEYIFSFTNQN